MSPLSFVLVSFVVLRTVAGNDTCEEITQHCSDIDNQYFSSSNAAQLWQAIESGVPNNLNIPIRFTCRWLSDASQCSKSYYDQCSPSMSPVAQLIDNLQEQICKSTFINNIAYSVIRCNKKVNLWGIVEEAYNNMLAASSSGEPVLPDSQCRFLHEILLQFWNLDVPSECGSRDYSMVMRLYGIFYSTFGCTV